MNYRFIKLSVLVVNLLLLCNCVKHVPGPKGEQGTAAPQGTLKMTYSAMFNIPSAAWTLDGNRYKTSVPVSTLTDYVLTHGDIEVYMKVGDEWWKLPYGVGDVFMQAAFETEIMDLDYAKIHDGPPAKPEMIQIKLVVFEPAR